MSVLSEYEHDPELHIKKLKIKEKQMMTILRIFKKYENFNEKSKDSESVLFKVKEKLKEYREEYPEFFI